MAKRSHLYSYHRDRGRITEFAGYDMPLWYSGIVEEHNAVRNAAGIFDVSHMGRFSISGQGATAFLDHVLPSDVKKVKTGRAFYSTVCNENGGIIEDTVTNKVDDENYVMVVNSSNKAKDWDWLESHARDYTVRLRDESDNSALLAFQGPVAEKVLQKICDVDLSTVKRFAVVGCKVSGHDCLVSRTGYTGEDGFEIDVLDCPLDSPEKALGIWNSLLSNGKEHGVVACGLGARDSLRLEAGMCLYGNDIDESITPVEAVLESVISQTKEESYIGRQCIEQQLKEGTKRKRVAFSMDSGGIPRHGYQIKLSGGSIGSVTSGTFSPTLKRGIGMGYVPTELSAEGRSLSIQIRNDGQIATIVPTPFYDSTKYGYKRKK